MDLKEILSVSGRAGLFKVIAQAKNGAIVESLIDKKRFPVFTTDKISTLADISVFCENEDMPLKDVLKKLLEHAQSQPIEGVAEDATALKAYFEAFLPEYDKERVYVSDMKKIINWFNLLLKNDILNFEVEETAAIEATEPSETENVEPKATE